MLSFVAFRQATSGILFERTVLNVIQRTGGTISLDEKSSRDFSSLLDLIIFR